MVHLERNGHFDMAEDLQLAARITETLDKHYPGYLWGVIFNEDGGVVHIINETINATLMTNSIMAYTLKLDRIQTDPDLKCVIRAGGEYLERGNLVRGRWNGEYAKRVDGVLEKHQPILNEDGTPCLIY